jgi:hypothetical protein
MSQPSTPVSRRCARPPFVSRLSALAKPRFTRRLRPRFIRQPSPSPRRASRPSILLMVSGRPTATASHDEVACRLFMIFGRILWRRKPAIRNAPLLATSPAQSARRRYRSCRRNVAGQGAEGHIADAAAGWVPDLTFVMAIQLNERL